MKKSTIEIAQSDLNTILTVHDPRYGDHTFRELYSYEVEQIRQYGIHWFRDKVRRQKRRWEKCKNLTWKGRVKVAQTGVRPPGIIDATPA